MVISILQEVITMPHWCSIDFDVSGPAEDIARFREAIRGCEDAETPLILIDSFRCHRNWAT
jgi:hypothetical protein